MNRLHKFPSTTLSVFMSLPILYSHDLLSYAMCLSSCIGTSAFTRISSSRHFVTSDQFLNCVLVYNPSLSFVFRYISGLWGPALNLTPLNNSPALFGSDFLYLLLFFFLNTPCFPDCAHSVP